MNVVAFVAGCAIVALTGFGVITVLILPRAPSGVGRISQVVLKTVHLVFDGMSRLRKDYEAKDAILAMTAPTALIVQLLSWSIGLVGGFALMLVPTTHSFALGFTQALTALFTAGAVHVGGRANTSIDIAAGASWVVTVALQIAYLPSLYSKFARRESLVSLLETRSGSPAWGPELLVRSKFGGVLNSLGPFYAEWERWAVEVAESHTTYPVLLYFRSPDPWSSWVIGLLSMLDAAALHMSLAPDTAPEGTRMFLHTGFNVVNQIADSMGWPVDHDPAEDAPIDLPYEEFARSVSILATYGFPMECTAEEAWPGFRGWRVNYERSAYLLADYLDAPPAPWSGSRNNVPVEDIKAHAPPHQLLDRAQGGLTPGSHGQRSRGSAPSEAD